MISLKVVTPSGVYTQKEVKSIRLKSVEGEMTILSNHMPLFASLKVCPLYLKDENDEILEYAISGGFFQFKDNASLLLTDAIEGRGEIDVERAKRAYERARARLDKKDSDTNMKRAQLSLERAINRIHVYGD